MLRRLWLVVVAAGLCGCGRLRFDTDPCASLLAGAACDDGASCTEDDRCDGSGACKGTPNDARCPDGPPSVCLPECYGGSSGCGVPPTSIAVTCTSGTAGEASCSVVTDGVSVGPGCLSCGATVGYVPLVESDFEDSARVCDPDGWQLASGSVCIDGATGCSTTGTAIACCSNFTGLCASDYLGISFMQSVFEENCGGGLKQWRVSRVVDATAVTDVRLCYDAAEAYADANDAIIAGVKDGVSSAQLDCVQGDTNWRGTFQTRCVDLPAWASNNPAVDLTFVGHNDAAHAAYPTEIKRMALDNVLLYGREPACTTQSRAVVFEETFTGCTNPITEGFHGWSVTRGSPTCSSAACAGGGQGAVAAGTEWALARRVDTSALSGAVNLCFQVGHVAAIDTNARVLVRIDVGDGAGWRRVAGGSLYQASANQCEQVCFDLSAASPAAAHNPDLGIEITASSPAGVQTLVDDIRVEGVQSCDGDAFVSVGPPTDVGGGSFDLTVVNKASQPLTAQLTCTWTDGAQRNIASTPVRLE